MTVARPSRAVKPEISCMERQPGVLLADPDVAGRESLASHLQRCGFHVWTAATGLEAFSLYLDHTGEIDVLVLDGDLADPPASVLVRRIRAHFPGVVCCCLIHEPLSTRSGLDELRIPVFSHTVGPADLYCRLLGMLVHEPGDDSEPAFG